MRTETIALHVGYQSSAETSAVSARIHQTVAHTFGGAEHAGALFEREADDCRYSGTGNSTTSVLEQRISALEGGLACLCVTTGQAALHYSLLNLAKPGSNIVSVPQLQGTTHTLLSHLLPSFGVSVRFTESEQGASVERLIDDQTCAVFCESVGNPAGNICDIETLATIAHSHGVPLIVDNTAATPILLRPIEYGADIVVHSLEKFIGGHGSILGGAIVDSGNFPWQRYPDKYRMFSRPDTSCHGLVYSERFQRTAYLERCRSYYQRVTGSVLSPFNALLLLQGIETLALRVERHVANAGTVANYLTGHPKVEWVNYAGFETSHYHALAHKYLGGQACSLMSFGLQGGYAAAARVYDALGLVMRCVNLGDAKSRANHPASTTHRLMSTDTQGWAAVDPGMIRLSVGIENVEDIIDDLSNALKDA